MTWLKTEASGLSRPHGLLLTKSIEIVKKSCLRVCKTSTFCTADGLANNYERCRLPSAAIPLTNRLGSAEKVHDALYWVAIVLLVLAAVALLWPSKLRTGFRIIGLIAVMAAIGSFAVVLLNLPRSPCCAANFRFLLTERLPDQRRSPLEGSRLRVAI
jgi:hypothetical protein